MIIIKQATIANIELSLTSSGHILICHTNEDGDDIEALDIILEQSSINDFIHALRAIQILENK